jgi:hypothetical protein
MLYMMDIFPKKTSGPVVTSGHLGLDASCTCRVANAFIM